MSARAYITRVFVLALLLACGVVAFNYVVDPYGLIGSARVEGFNQFKVDSNAHTRLLKKYQPNFGRYDTLIVGKSRVEMGIDPTHHCFDESAMRVYNLGIPGAELPTQFAYALNVIYQQPIEHVLISVDFTDYISTRQASVSRRPLYMQQGQGSLRYFPDGSVNEAFWQTVFSDHLKSLFSLDALTSAVKTVATQSDAAADRTDLGFNPGQDFAAMVRVEGPRALFDQKLAELKSKYGRSWYFRDAQGNASSAIDDLAQFLDLLMARGIDVTLFANPLHEKFWEVMEKNGHMPLYREWQDSMTQMLQKRSSGALRYWDFSGDSPYIHEQVPAAGVKSGPLEWFWEPSHYRRELGDLMLETMLSERCGTRPVFGRRVL